jgi:plasmid stabilization system protein ParE
VKIRITRRAEREIERKAARWEKKAHFSPQLFWSELGRALERLERDPNAGARWVSPSGRALYRLLLNETKNHLYYSYDEGSDVLTIRCLWGAQRGREPKL